MIKNKLFLKKIVSYLPIFLSQYIRKIYYKFINITYFIPIEEKDTQKKLKTKKAIDLILKILKDLKINIIFLVFKDRSIKDYSSKKLQIIKNLIYMNNGEIAYDGDNPFNIEIVSKNILDFYSKNNDIEKYPYRFFYIKDKFKVLNIGAMHRSYNFNGTFSLPSGGTSIGDGGPVENRLQFIPDLKGKSFFRHWF